MFVQIHSGYAAIRQALARRRVRTVPGPRYVRKARASHTPYGRRAWEHSAGHTGRHRASAVRPSYSHPASRARGAAYAVLRRPRPLPTGPGARRTSAAPARRAPAAHRAPARDAVPPRSTALILARHIPSRMNATVRAWLADPNHGIRSHRPQNGPHRRDNVYLPSIGWCWVRTQERPILENPA